MKFSCTPVSFFADFESREMTLQEWISSAHLLELDGVNINMSFLESRAQSYLSDIKYFSDYYKVPIVMAVSDNDFINSDELRWEQEIFYCLRDIGICAKLGIEYLRILCNTGYAEMQSAEYMRRAADGIMKCAETAERHGVKLVLEHGNCSDKWNRDEKRGSSGIFLDILGKIWDSNVGINFNTAAFDENTLEILKQILPKVEMVHVSDKKGFSENEETVIGTGVAHLGECFRILKNSGYDKWLSIEEASYKGEAGLRESIKNTKKIWKDS